MKEWLHVDSRDVGAKSSRLQKCTNGTSATQYQAFQGDRYGEGESGIPFGEGVSAPVVPGQCAFPSPAP